MSQIRVSGDSSRYINRSSRSKHRTYRPHTSGLPATSRADSNRIRTSSRTCAPIAIEKSITWLLCDYIELHGMSDMQYLSCVYKAQFVHLYLPRYYLSSITVMFVFSFCGFCSQTSTGALPLDSRCLRTAMLIRRYWVSQDATERVLWCVKHFCTVLFLVEL